MDTWLTHLTHLAVFFAQTLIIMGAIGGLLVLFFVMLSQLRDQQREDAPQLENISKKWRNLKVDLLQELLDKEEWKKQHKAAAKEKKRQEHKKRDRAFLIEFKGDLRASQSEQLRKQVDALLLVATTKDEVICRIESPGGLVTSYGLAAAQLVRIRDAGLRLTVAVDEVAASGGYMMACVAHEIVAAPFAVVGSIGVVAQVPNVHRLLEKNNIDYLEVTAGQYKRTISYLGEIKPEGLTKFKEQIEDTHMLFREFLGSYRPQVNVEKVATGEHWYGERALKLGLVDRLQTSDGLLLDLYPKKEIYKISLPAPKGLLNRMKVGILDTLEEAIDRLVYTFSKARFGR